MLTLDSPMGKHTHGLFKTVDAGNIPHAQALVPSQGRVAHDGDAGSLDSLRSKARHTKSRGDSTTIEGVEPLGAKRRRTRPRW